MNSESKVTRRELLRRAAGAGLGAMAAMPAVRALAGAAAPAKAKPNFVFILVDDLAVSAMGLAKRFKFLKTPNIDRLAAEGMVCDNAFVTTSLCQPSRATFMTGCYAHTTGVRINSSATIDPAKTPAVTEYLKKGGYETAFIGKWHMPLWVMEKMSLDYWVGFRGQGKYKNPTLFENSLKPFTKQGYMTDILTDYAVNWLEKGRAGEKPFCMFLWHKGVHGPFTPAPRHAEAFGDVELAEPVSWTDDYHDKPRWMRRAFQYGTKRKAWRESEDKPVRAKLPPKKWQPRNKMRLDYLRSILAIDDSVGRVYESLKKAGELDNTVFIFSSDNGYFFGEHRRVDKRLMYEESIRIPMLIRYPKLIKGGAHLPQIILNNDIAPTMLALAGLAAPDHMDGKNFLPLLKGQNAPWRKSFLYEYYSGGTYPAMQTTVGVRTDRHKYITYPLVKDDTDELYDLQADPHEMTNLINDPAAAGALKKMQAELARLKKETKYPGPVNLP